MQSLSKRFEGREREILRDVKLEGSIGAMFKWGVNGTIAWDKLVLNCKKVVGNAESDNMGMPCNSGKSDDKASNLQINRLMFSRSQSLAEELVDAFQNKVVELATKNKALEDRIRLLEEQIKYYRCDKDSKLADKMIGVLQGIR